MPGLNDCPLEANNGHCRLGVNPRATMRFGAIHTLPIAFWSGGILDAWTYGCRDIFEITLWEGEASTANTVEEHIS
jgi:hypothetical protein